MKTTHGTAIVLVAAAILASSCANLFNMVDLEPVTIRNQATYTIKTQKEAVAIAERAALKCNMCTVSATDDTVVTQLDYPRCLICFTATFRIDEKMTYTIALKEIIMEGKGHNYTVNYINKMLHKWELEIWDGMRQASSDF